MTHKLAIPAVLAVSAVAVAVGCPSDDASETSGATGSQDVPDCPSLEDQPACGAEYGCVWYPDLELCVVVCVFVEDEATCDEQRFCYWTANGECDYDGI